MRAYNYSGKEGDTASASAYSSVEAPSRQAAPQQSRVDVQVQQVVRQVPKVGRNDPCPCGSGKKYKHCCGR